MTWADPGAWYIGAAYLVALVALGVLVWSATRQWRSRRVSWRLDGRSWPVDGRSRPVPDDRGRTASAPSATVPGATSSPTPRRAELSLTNTGTGTAFGLETIRCAGDGSAPQRFAEVPVLRPGESVRIVMDLADERAWQRCWIRPRCRPSHRRFDSSRRRFARIRVARALARTSQRVPAGTL
ncbi:hypothetical protein C0Z11_01645 [Acidipropionibacterium jensenii]|uniref:hypothetical protein n=1 Tax=Acidipropionibacterium jensenii TaxID=1749 RepID=UPI000BC35388|nr:hypothetical protein [Acidipropionibacterium jensenii]AZZ41202.1 hypothetical protein C0Z11_01645 [Acidipropionibacterium jensenii]